MRRVATGGEAPQAAQHPKGVVIHPEGCLPHRRVHNQLFTVEGDRAVGETYGTADHVHEVDGRAEVVAWSLRYQDELQRDGDAWRFTSRRLILDWEEIRPVGGSVAAVQDERITVAQTVYKYATGIDTSDWVMYRSILADNVEMDFESWNVIVRHTMRADELAKNIQVYFAGLDATQHSMSNPRVTIDGDRAQCVLWTHGDRSFMDDAFERGAARVGKG